MFSLCADGFCGIAPKAGSTLAGVYMILMSNMCLIFEYGHLNRSVVLLHRADLQESTTLVWIIPYCYYVSITLTLITYPICAYFLYSIQKRNTVGLFIYIIWIIFYDVSCCINKVLVSRAAHFARFSISPLEWFGLATRIPADCFWLSFVINFALLVIEGKSTGRMSLRTRRVSRHVTEPSRFRLGVNARRIQ
ncbi:transmembrane protein 217 [Elgaria multicarinata webbii]|uniref:transmembrane protein 217 n=1 Tax=Elgaria multicarinata webbii TaxID=159646 RepID=UPI002FCD59B6